MSIPLEVFLLAGLLLTLTLAAGLSVEMAKAAFGRLEGDRWSDRLPFLAAAFGGLWGFVGSPVLTRALEKIFPAVADGELAEFPSLWVWWVFIGVGCGWASAGVYRQVKLWARPGLVRLLDWWKTDR